MLANLLPEYASLAIPLGLLLVIPWVVLAAVQREAGFTPTAVERSAFNPFVEFTNPAAAWGFLALRMAGLVAEGALFV